MGKHERSHSEQTFQTEIGQKVTVHREQLGSADASPVNRKLCELGLAVQDAHSKLQPYTYFGSAAVHIYASEIANSLTYVSQTDPLLLYRCPEFMAARAFDDLLRALKQTYGKTHGRLRSGF